MPDRQSSLTTKHVLSIGADRLVTSMDGDDGRRATDSWAASASKALAPEKAECSS